jgi:predicted acyltransferase
MAIAPLAAMKLLGGPLVGQRLHEVGGPFADPMTVVDREAPSATPAAASPLERSARLRSIDVFRGAAIAAMILVNCEFSHDEAYHQLVHASWNGWTFADTIFPSFLFIVGVSLTLSTASRLARGDSRSHLLGHAVRRSALLFASGVVVDWLRVPARTFPYVGLQGHLQLTGVLQKIAVCYLVAFLIFLWAGLWGTVAGIVALSALYAGLLFFYPVPGCGPASLDMGCNFPDYLDGVLLHGFRSNDAAYDPDGLGAVPSAVTSVLFGVLAGIFLRREPRSQRRAFGLFGGGLALIATGLAVATWLPINKPLWTTSFAVLMAGLSALALAGCMWLVDGRAFRSWLRPIEILGQNAVAAYLISRLVGNLPRVHVLGRSLYTDVLARVATPPNASLLFAMLVLAMVYLAVGAMDRRGWQLKF